MAYLWTGQVTCHDEAGREIPCEGTGQDAEFRRGIPWPEPRFEVKGDTVQDLLTGLEWTRDANPAELPLSWEESLAFVEALNRKAHSDWRLPDRRELLSLMSYQTRKPALPDGHPFDNVFQGWYWTSTPAAVDPAYAWYVHLEGARMFYGKKDEYHLVWPVRGESVVLDREVEGPRFVEEADGIRDSLTGLVWHRNADLTSGPVTWQEALDAVGPGWRLPNINELESLVDITRHSPALPEVFGDVPDGHWSSTTSMFEPDWAWALYTYKGALGVGRKDGRYFRVWAVRDNDLSHGV